MGRSLYAPNESLLSLLSTTRYDYAGRRGRLATGSNGMNRLCDEGDAPDRSQVISPPDSHEGAVVCDQSGKPYRMVGSHLDITERKRSEQSLREREAQLIAAQRIQEQLLPRSWPEVPGFDISGTVYPAEFTAGDHVDHIPISENAK